MLRNQFLIESIKLKNSYYLKNYLFPDAILQTISHSKQKIIIQVQLLSLEFKKQKNLQLGSQYLFSAEQNYEKNLNLVSQLMVCNIYLNYNIQSNLFLFNEQEYLIKIQSVFNSDQQLLLGFMKLNIYFFTTMECGSITLIQTLSEMAKQLLTLMLLNYQILEFEQFYLLYKNVIQLTQIIIIDKAKTQDLCFNKEEGS
ncbi:hypothetical protein pb186bvf_005147 [Paramecium bursaria]